MVVSMKAYRLKSARSGAWGKVQEGPCTKPQAPSKQTPLAVRMSQEFGAHLPGPLRQGPDLSLGVDNFFTAQGTSLQLNKVFTKHL